MTIFIIYFNIYYSVTTGKLLLTVPSAPNNTHTRAYKGERWNSIKDSMAAFRISKEIPITSLAFVKNVN